LRLNSKLPPCVRTVRYFGTSATRTTVKETGKLVERYENMEACLGHG
jgi:hypothetical protein